MNPKVSIVILNYITYEYTLTLIDMIEERIAYDNYEIVVVDNGSLNESPRVLSDAAADRDFCFIENNSNSGYAAGNNLGIKCAIKHNSKYVLVINNDIIPESDLLDRLVEVAESDSRIGAVSPKIMKPDSEEELQFIDRPTVWDMSFGYMAYRMRRKRFDSDQTVRIYRPQGCCMLLSAKAMQDVDFMDERTFLYGEEDILAERLLNKSYICWCCGSAGVVHNHAATVSKVMGKLKKALLYATGCHIYWKDYRNVRNPLTLAMLLFFRFVVAVFRN